MAESATPPRPHLHEHQHAMVLSDDVQFAVASAIAPVQDGVAARRQAPGTGEVLAPLPSRCRAMVMAGGCCKRVAGESRGFEARCGSKHAGSKHEGSQRAAKPVVLTARSEA